MMRSRVFILFCLMFAICVLPSVAQTVSVTWNFANVTGNSNGVKSLTYTPLYIYTNTAAKAILQTPIRISLAANPGLTNGYFTTNLYTGVVYDTAIADSYSVYHYTNYFFPSDAGTSVDAYNRQAIPGWPNALYVIATSSLVPAGTLTNTQTGVTLGGTFSGNGSGLTNVMAAQLSNPFNVGGVDINALGGWVNFSNFTFGVAAPFYKGDGSLLTSLPAQTNASLVRHNGTATNLNLIISGTTMFVSGTNANGAELIVTNAATTGWSGLTLQGDNGSPNTNYWTAWLNNSQYPLAATSTGGPDDMGMEINGGNFYVDFNGSSRHFFIGYRASQNSAVQTNVDISSTGANFTVPVTVNGAAVPTNTAYIYSVTNRGYHAAGAGVAAVNGDYFTIFTNYFGNIGTVYYTNCTTPQVVRMDNSGGYFVVSLFTNGLIQFYDDGGANSVLGGSWELYSGGTGTNPVPTWTATNRVQIFTNYAVASGLLSNNVIWVDPNGTDSTAASIGNGHYFPYPFGNNSIFNNAILAGSTNYAELDGVLQSAPAGSTVQLTPGTYAIYLSEAFNGNYLAYGSTIYFGAYCCTASQYFKGNTTWEGGTWISGDTGEPLLHSETVTNLTFKNANIRLASGTLFVAAMTNANSVTFDDCTINTSMNLPWIIKGANGTSNLVVTLRNCRFSRNWEGAVGDSNPGGQVQYSTLLFSNCIALVDHCSFEWSSNPFVKPSNSYHIGIGLNAYVAIGGCSFNNTVWTNGSTATNILKLSASSLSVITNAMYP